MIATLAAITRHSVANYVITLVYVYVILIFIRVLMSWLPRVPYNRVLDIFLTFVRDVVDPYLNLFRRLLPMARIGPAAIDLSPMIGTIVLILVGNLVANLIRGG
jgi:YggT family protein